eukprot:jgi/Astpho2/2904/Aster-01053
MAPTELVPIVVVTGVSGFIGSHVAKQLLEKGYHVRGTVRGGGTKKYGFLTKLGEALPGTLELVEGDIMKEGAFDEACKGATYVLHTASPFVIHSDQPQEELVDVAVNGTHNVLSSVVKNKESIRRVLVTSSFAAIRSGKNPVPAKGGSLYTEEDWNNSSTLEDEPYMLSKTLAEKKAWEMAKENGLDMVTINPVFVLGPVLSERKDATSIGLFQKFMQGESEDLVPRIVDVRDVARAHVRAMEEPSASGRYIASLQHAIDTKLAVDALQQRFPGYKLPKGKQGEREQIIDNSKILKLIGGLRPAEETLIDMARTMIDKGILTQP